MKYKVITGTDIQYNDIQEAIELDCLSYKECYRGKIEDCLNWFKVNSDIYLMIKDLNSNHIIAYVNIMPITNECYDNIRSGKLIDVGIKSNMIMQYKQNQECNIYLSSIVIHPKYRNTILLRILLNAVLKNLNKKRIFINRILADAITFEGQKLVNFFGMKKVRCTNHNSSIYEISLMQKLENITILAKRLFR